MATVQHPAAENHEIKQAIYRKKRRKSLFSRCLLFIPNRLSLREHALLIAIFKKNTHSLPHEER